MILFAFLSLLLVGLTNTQVLPNQEVPPIVHKLVLLKPYPIENIPLRDNLMLECSASGNPAPTIEWSFNGVKFVKDKPSNGIEGSEVLHTISGNRITIRKVKGKTNGDPSYYNSGRYRCIATNNVGSVFLEKNIQIRVMGVFMRGNRYENDAAEQKVTVGRSFKMPCPQHRSGYGTSYRWGIVDAKNMIPEYWIAGSPNNHSFPTTNGDFVWSVMTHGDVVESRDVGGLRCILINFGITEASNQQILKQYDKVIEGRKPRIVASLPKIMNAAVNSEFRMVCGATAYPVPTYKWQYQGMDIKSRYPGSTQLNFEFFQLLGNGMELRIRRVTRYSGGTFRCIVENEYGIVWTIGQLTVQFPPKWITNFPDVVDVPLDNKFKLVCNASGTPYPTIEWFQNGTKLVKKNNDLRKTFTGENPRVDKGGVLTIQKTDFSDNGIYICVAYNELDTLTQSIFIKVQELAPNFNERPLDNPIYLFRTSTMVINCLPSGGPIPVNTWAKDSAAIAIVDGGRYKLHQNGSLEIKNVVKEDEGVYECKATNRNGNAKSEGKAVVLEPTIITKPPEQLTFAVGWGYAAIFCGATWDPRLDLRIEWYKGGVKMAKFSDRIFLEGRATGPPRILYLKNLTIDDAGNYTCHAYTKVGNVISQQWKTAELIIKGPPEPPAGVTVVNGCGDFSAELQWSRGEEIGVETRRFYIEFSTNTSAFSDHWYGGQGDKILDYKDKIVAEPGTRVKYALTKKDLVPGASLIFRIRAASDHLVGRPSRPSRQGQCITPSGKPVMNPLNVTGITKTQGTLFISWRPITDVYYGAPGFFYEVGYRTIGATTYTTKEIRNLNVTQFAIPSPGINKQFQFYVRSKNDLGYGPESKIVEAYSGKEPPTSAPTNFKVTSIQRFEVGFAWSAVTNADGYMLKYWNYTNAEHLRGRSRRSVSSVPIVIKYKRFIKEPSETYPPSAGSLVNTDNVTAQVSYRAAIAPYNTGGIGPYSDLITFTTNARAPGKPSNVDFQVYGRSAHISWHPPFYPNGYIEQYEISWYRSNTESTRTSKSYDGATQITKDRRSREAYLINVFEPMTYYNIKLSARNRVGPGDDWEKILVAVSADDVPGKPGAPKTKSFDDSAINVTFQRPSYGGLPSKFYVYYRPTSQYYKEPKRMEQKFPKRAWILVKELEFLVYDFWTVGVNSLGQSETSDVIEQQPIRRPKPQAHASQFEWWRSNWFIAIGMCALFVLITMIVVIILLKSGPVAYIRLSEQKGGYNGYGGKSTGYAAGSSGYGAQPLQDMPPTSTSYGDKYEDRQNASASAPSSEHDAPPPRYSSQSSMEKKEDVSGSEEGSRTGSDSSGSETGSDYSDEEDDRSYYSDEQKKRDSGTPSGSGSGSGSEEEEENEDDLSTFV